MKRIIYGAGLRLDQYLASEEGDVSNVVAIADKKNDHIGTSINGIKVISPSEILDYEYDKVVISSKKYYDEIKKELEMLGVNPGSIELLEFEDEDKYDGELAFWISRYRAEGQNFKNDHYERLFLEIAGEQDDSFLKGKVVADFGCGPRGSLAWTSAPSCKIGIDVLVNRYMRLFSCMKKHGMIYVNCDEYVIPIPDSYVDVLSTINSLDHVFNLKEMLEEIARIIKPGGILLASFNMNEPKTVEEPQTLIEETLLKNLETYFSIEKNERAPEWYAGSNEGNTDAYKIWIKA